jgi:hypothetical protein
MGWLRSLWRGEVTLAQAFWWYGFVMWLASTAVIGLVTSYLLLNGYHAYSKLVLLIFMQACYIYSLPLSVGIWRSAGHYQGNKALRIIARIYAASLLCSTAAYFGRAIWLVLPLAR